MKQLGKFCLRHLNKLNELKIKIASIFIVSIVAILVDVSTRSVVVAILLDCLSRNVSPLGLPFYSCMP